MLERIVLWMLVVASLAYGYDKTNVEYWSTCDHKVKSLHNVFEVCYSDTLNVPIAGVSKIEAEKMNVGNITKRPTFKKTTTGVVWLKPSEIKMPYQLGHIFANDGDNDYSQDTLNDTYDMINITPQHHTVNQGIWKKIESRGKELAGENDEAYAITLIDYKPNKFGYKQYPSSYTRIYVTDNDEECYRVKNKNVSKFSKNIIDYKIECSSILK